MQDSIISPTRNSVAAEALFRDRLAALGVTLDGDYLGSEVMHAARCAAGHSIAVLPRTLGRRTTICRSCPSDRDRRRRDDTEARFRARVAEMGGTVVEPRWINTMTPHRVRCADGHETAPRPDSVLAGRGICRVCSGKLWDALYVVTGPAVVKFGITSGDPRPRLARHALIGIDRVVRLFTDVAPPIPRDVENAVKARLRLAGWQPVRGTEFFALDALPDVLAVVDDRSAGLRE